MTEKILDKCIGYPYDIICKWFRQNNLHHLIKMNTNFDDLLKVFKVWQKVSYRPTQEERILMILYLCPDGFYHKHQCNELYNLISGHNKSSKKKISLTKIKKICENKIKDHDKKQKELSEMTRYCHFTDQEI